MNKKLLLLAGILVLGTTTFAVHTPTPTEADATITAEKAASVISITDSTAIKGLLETRQTGMMGEFSGSYAGEVRVRSWQGPGRSDKETTNDNYSESVNKIEWTVAEGKLNMGKLGFAYSVDRDYNFDKNWNKQSEGWDTKFGLDYQVGTFDMLGKEWAFAPMLSYGYDTAENFTSDAKDLTIGDFSKKRLWRFTPKISTTYNGFAMDISPIVAYDDISETTAFKIEIDNYRRLGTTGFWSTYGTVYLDFAGNEKEGSYANGVFEGNIDADNKFAVSIEQYLDYERKIAKNIYFKTEFGLEAYSMLQSEADNVSMYVAPEVQYRAKLGDVNVVPYVKYITYTATGAYESDAGDQSYRNELSAGVRISTSF
ncbi:hypothetical protein [Psychrilyobacter sp.]|uniref:hypothetical protein n=1 Tax=Psychrilyobacter sp. TaxID=2586924 RepID=UPI0030192AD1